MINFQIEDYSPNQSKELKFVKIPWSFTEKSNVLITSYKKLKK